MGIKARPYDAPDAEYWGHNIEKSTPEKIASHFEVAISKGTRKDDLVKLFKEFGDDVELRFLLTQNYEILLGNELHDQIIEHNAQLGEKYLRGVVKGYKQNPVKMLSEPSEIAQFFRAKSEIPTAYQPAVDIISQKLLKYIDTLKSL